MEMENIKNAASGIVTKSRLKKLGALLVLAAVVTGGASYYMHEQKIAHRTAAAAAQTAMITAQAERESVSLISEAEARAIAATAVGKDESTLTFRRVDLTNAADRDEKRNKHDKRDKHDKDKKHEKGEKHKERRDRGDVTTEDYFKLVETQRDRGAPAPMDGMSTPPAPNAPAPMPEARPDFLPVYNVTCTDGTVKYKVRIDAATGNILSSRVDD
ncbi:PepSY domain-containing protein [Selenomonas artemidis]|uniref:PepSY domain-containing protein n=1 Tax=Selenomonas artemidis TaxID=671224 RepID=UPI002889C7F4|nr:PepSY domain-containing protein [Selenomonas artemidis]